MAVTLTGANRHDVTQLLPLVDAVPPVAGKPGRPRRRFDCTQGDRAYDSNPHRRELRRRKTRPVLARRFTPHGSGLGVYRWVVERTEAGCTRTAGSRSATSDGPTSTSPFEVGLRFDLSQLPQRFILLGALSRPRREPRMRERGWKKLRGRLVSRSGGSMPKSLRFLWSFSRYFQSRVRPMCPRRFRFGQTARPVRKVRTTPEIGKPEGPERNFTNITNVHNPSILPYLPAKEKATGVGVIVLPGGGHRNLAISHEGYNVGEWLADRGIAAFVVKYRLAREPGSTYKIEVEALADTQRAIRLVRNRAKEWNVNPDALGVMGFSAGGELAYMACVRMDGGIENSSDAIDRESAKPNFQALIYPGTSGKIVPTKDSPPVFLACGNLDRPDISQGLAEVICASNRSACRRNCTSTQKWGTDLG